MKWVRIIFSAAVIGVIQSALLSRISINGIVPNLLFVFSLCFCAENGNLSASAAVAVLCGILCDSFTVNGMGSMIIMFTYPVILMAMLGELVYKKNAFICIAAVMVLSIFGEVLYYLMNMSVLKERSFAEAFVSVILPTAAYNTAAASVYYAVRRLFVSTRRRRA